jgi:glycosyltransferase involved in cell wall biosynthesis
VQAVQLSIIVPFFNESASVDAFFDAVFPILASTGLSFDIICVNDGSTDDTLERLKSFKKKHLQTKILDLSRNFGKDAALTAGLDFADGECVIPMDCDLQDPPEIILEMLEKWRQGAEVVLAKRIDRREETLLKRSTASLFYRLYNLLADLKIPGDVGDFRLMTHAVVQAVRSMPENRRFMKGIFAFAGFKTEVVEYDRPERKKGETKWSYWKLVSYAIDGIISFSSFPLRISTLLGVLVMGTAFVRGLQILCRVFLVGKEVPGYASLSVGMLFLGGTQLIILGIIGEYIGRMYMESKRRPVYFVRERIE